MDDQLLNASEVADKEMAFTTNVPTEADPDSKGAVDMPTGFHRVAIVDFQIAVNHEFTRKGETFICHQLRPKLEIPDGSPHAGARCLDFLPLPMGDQTITVDMMNQWYNFLRAFGFSVVKGSAAPTGFHPKQLIGSQAVIEIVNQTDRDGIVKTYPDGRIRTGVRFFGYHGLDKLKDLQQQDAAKPAGRTPTSPPAVAQTPAAAGFAL